MTRRRDPLFQFALRRKTGYISVYGLAMIYPSWRTSLYFFHLGKNTDYCPLMMKIGHNGKWRHVPALLIRLPSWIARKVDNRDIGGFTRRAGHPEYVMCWDRQGTVTRSQARRVYRQRKSIS